MPLRAAVTKLVETVQPTVDFSYHKYLQAHDVVVASEAYNRALETASSIIHKVGWRRAHFQVQPAKAPRSSLMSAQRCRTASLLKHKAAGIRTFLRWMAGKSGTSALMQRLGSCRGSSKRSVVRWLRLGPCKGSYVVLAQPSCVAALGFGRTCVSCLHDQAVGGARGQAGICEARAAQLWFIAAAHMALTGRGR